MGRAVICKGDKTTHGGEVLEGSANFTIDGRHVARQGDMTFCPQCKGKFPIAEGVENHMIFGAGTVVENMKTACGATLIASQQRMTIDAGGGGDAASQPASNTSKDRPGVRFRAVDEASGKAVPGVPYRMEVEGGAVLRGQTDAEGYTQFAESDNPSKVQLFWETEHD